MFALKGGTAINLLVRDMPRLSVDLDLVFPNYSLPRDPALAQIYEAIRTAAQRLKTRGFQVRTVTATGAGETKLWVRSLLLHTSHAISAEFLISPKKMLDTRAWIA